MFRIINGVTCIDGKNGKYDKKINNGDVKYARNAISNYTDTYSPQSLKDNCSGAKMPKAPKLRKIQKGGNNVFTRLFNKIAINSTMRKTDNYIKKMDKYLSETDKELDSIPTVKFNLKYAQSNAGKIDTIAPVAAAYEEMGKKLSIGVNELTKKLKGTVSHNLSHLVSAKSLDLNKDGNIDIGEYASSILVEDMISTSQSGNLQPSDVNGLITDVGQQALLTFANKKNYKSSNYIFGKVYSDFKLDEAAKRFTADNNNLI